MKKIVFTITTLLSVFTLTAQRFQATLKVGIQPNSVKVFIRPDANISGTMSTLHFSLVVPSSVTPRPTTTMISTPAGYSWSPVSEISPKSGGGNSYHVYTYFLSASPTVNFVANTEFEIAEVAFNNAPGTSNVGLACFEDGSDIAYFNISIGTNQDIVVTAAPLYGPGASNQTWLTGFSIVQLSNIALPVKFLSFIALKSGDDAKLSWTVENDVDNRYFELERSKDGREFKAFAKIDALGNGKAVNTYSLTDVRISNVGSKVVYYRVKQVDKDGTITYSNIRNLGIERNGIAVSIYPNPARSITKLVFDAEKAGRGNVLIRDMNGKLVQQVASQFIAGVNQQELNVSNLAAGEYNVTITGTGFDHTLKLTKVN